MELNLKNKKVLVLGSSTGIGKSIAESFLKEGATVMLAARNLERLQATAQELGTPHFESVDLSKKGAGQAVVETALKKMGGIDVLVINTGGPKKGSFLDISEAQWNDDFQNLWLSMVESLKVALPKMQQQKFGRILVVTSLAAKEPVAGLTTSNGLRSGLTGLCKSIANEYASHGITVNLLLPGYTDTDRIRELKLSPEKIKEMVPAGRLGDPKELAALATFLGSPIAGYITGQSIAVDGGVIKGH